jgi:hypothetical protein
VVPPPISVGDQHLLHLRPQQHLQVLAVDNEECI